MMPTVGAAFDMLNAAWYYAEGNYGEAALSFFGALPGIGDMAVAGVKGLGFCTKGAKIFRLAAKIIGNAGNIVLSVPKVTDAIIQLWDKHVFKGQGWDDESLSLAIEGATFGITAILSAKNLGETFGNIRNELNDIKTSQCFVEGTLIVTADGDRPIEEIQAGDLVYSTNPETGESEYKEVLRTFRKESDVLIHIFVNGEEIETTPVHPFWVEDQWVAAKDLEEGDILTLADGTTAPVTYTYGEQLDEPVIVYNFEVAEFHTYYVTDTGVLVHNDSNYNGAGKNKSKDKRKTPGVAVGSGDGNISHMMRGSQGNIGLIPTEIADKIRGKKFNSFDDFRKEFWTLVANSKYANEFSSSNITRMMGGNAPKAALTQQYGGLSTYILHHKKTISSGGGVFDLDNIVIVSPRMHQEILDKSVHFGH